MVSQKVTVTVAHVIKPAPSTLEVLPEKESSFKLNITNTLLLVILLLWIISWRLPFNINEYVIFNNNKKLFTV